MKWAKGSYTEPNRIIVSNGENSRKISESSEHHTNNWPTATLKLCFQYRLQLQAATNALFIIIIFFCFFFLSHEVPFHSLVTILVCFISLFPVRAFLFCCLFIIFLFCFCFLFDCPCYFATAMIVFVYVSDGFISCPSQSDYICYFFNFSQHVRTYIFTIFNGHMDWFPLHLKNTHWKLVAICFIFFLLLLFFLFHSILFDSFIHWHSCIRKYIYSNRIYSTIQNTSPVRNAHKICVSFPPFILALHSNDEYFVETKMKLKTKFRCSYVTYVV